MSENDIYLTGSINEPSGNHHIEAALCGLPALYLQSGGIPEYCEGYGVGYKDLNEFEEKLYEIISNIDKYKSKLKDYSFNSENMNKEYLKLFSSLVVDNKKNIIKISKLYKLIYLIRFKLRKFTRNFSQVNLRIRIKKLIGL